MTRGSEGASCLAEAQRLLARCRIDPADVSDADYVALRRAARAAIDRLDDEPEFDEAHETLDEVGSLVRENRPRLCFLQSKDDDFVQTCPVALGHVRLGFSVGMEIEESHCSICKRDLWECPHVPGQTYDGHPVSRVITKAKLFEVSVVSRPDFADARITERLVSRADVEAMFGGPLPDNAQPVCDRCLTPCLGI